jgi:acetylornithine deacetylase/succinyl-diaminopimelate desuccinylase-like protein
MTMDELKENVSKIFPNKEIFNRIFNEQPRLQNFLKALNTFTKNLNIIEGGVKDNVIPGKCEAIMDFRTFPGIDAAMILDGLTQLITKDCNYPVKKEHKKESDEIYVTLELIHELEASYWSGWESSDRLKTLKSYTKKVYGRTPFYSLFPAATDARYLRNSGYCPQTVVFGPGDGSMPHAVDEYIEIADFINAIKVYALFGYNFLTSK